MRLEKLQQNEKSNRREFLDYINCGECYFLTTWINSENATVTLNQDTVLNDLHEKHGGRIWYNKFCMKTFRVYMGSSLDPDKVINQTEVDYSDRYNYTRLLKALITGEGLKRLSSFGCLVRWPKEGSSRGEDWYRLF